MSKNVKLTKAKVSKRTSIGVKLLIEIFMLLLIVCSTLTLISYLKSSMVMKSSIKENLTNSVEENAELLAQVLEQKKNEMETIGRREGITSMDWNVQETIVVSEAKRLGYERIQISSSDGSTRVSGLEPFSLSDKDNFKLSMTGVTNITTPLFSESDNQLIIIVTTPIIDNNGNILGVESTSEIQEHLGRTATVMGDVAHTSENLAQLAMDLNGVTTQFKVFN